MQRRCGYIDWCLLPHQVAGKVHDDETMQESTIMQTVRSKSQGDHLNSISPCKSSEFLTTSSPRFGLEQPCRTSSVALIGSHSVLHMFGVSSRDGAAVPPEFFVGLGRGGRLVVVAGVTYVFVHGCSWMGGRVPSFGLIYSRAKG